MADILEQIVAHKRIEVEEAKARIPLHQLEQQTDQLLAARSCNDAAERRSMRRSLAESSSGIIAEFKRKSPSKGWIKEEGTPEIIPPAYEANGASACSVLTDQQFFGGSLDFLERARQRVALPLLRKDFIIDPYQLFEARLSGADAVLLIAADLSLTACKELARQAHDLGLETLLEIHEERELDYVGDHIDMVGVNNRNLGTFITDVQNSFRLAEKLPPEFLKVSESGISNPQTVRELREAGFRGFLIGECFMKSADPGEALRNFISQI